MRWTTTIASRRRAARCGSSSPRRVRVASSSPRRPTVVGRRRRRRPTRRSARSSIARSTTSARCCSPTDVRRRRVRRGRRPWYMTLFGRDSLWTARFALPVDVRLAAGTLRTLARRQAAPLDVDHGGRAGQDPPRGAHRAADRRARAAARLLRHRRRHAAVDQPAPRRVVLGTRRRRGRSLLAAAGGGDGVADVARPVPVVPRRERPRPEQPGMEGLRRLDPGRAPGDIAVPADHAVRGAGLRVPCGASTRPRLLDAFDRPGGDAARRVRRAVCAAASAGGSGSTDRAAPFPAVALDGAGRRVDSLTSNIGHLPATGILDDDEVAAVAAQSRPAAPRQRLRAAHAGRRPPAVQPARLPHRHGVAARHGDRHRRAGADRPRRRRRPAGRSGCWTPSAHFEPAPARAVRRLAGERRAAAGVSGRRAARRRGRPAPPSSCCAPPSGCTPTSRRARWPSGPTPGFAALFPLTVTGLRVGEHRLDVHVDASGAATRRHGRPAGGRSPS